MTGLLALCIFSLVLLWVYYRDAKERRSISVSTWIVLVWLFIHGTRPVTMWFGWEVNATRDEGNPAEALVNFIVIVAGVIVLWSRSFRLSIFIKDNPWLCVFYLFWIFSITWSDYPLITFKRLFKDLGNVAIVLVVLTDRDPTEAMRAVCVRFAYLCIPLSIILIRYYPSLGRTYVGYHQDAVTYNGVATNKNALGVLVLVSILFVLWDLLESWKKRQGKFAITLRLLVLWMCGYLLLIINSVTSLICAALGSMLFLALRHPLLRKRPGRIEFLALISGGSLYVIDSIFGIQESVFRSLGRNATLTSRTEIWSIVQDLQVNPLFGMGFDTFWAGKRLEILADKLGVAGIIQAHNGYLETYLNGGFMGVTLLVMVLLSAYLRTRKRLLRFGSIEDQLCLTILFIALVYNYTEASFNKLGPLWFITCAAVMEYGKRGRSLGHSRISVQG